MSRGCCLSIACHLWSQTWIGRHHVRLYPSRCIGQRRTRTAGRKAEPGTHRPALSGYFGRRFQRTAPLTRNRTRNGPLGRDFRPAAHLPCHRAAPYDRLHFLLPRKSVDQDQRDNASGRPIGSFTHPSRRRAALSSGKKLIRQRASGK